MIRVLKNEIVDKSNVLYHTINKILQFKHLKNYCVWKNARCLIILSEYLQGFFQNLWLGID